MNAPAPQHAVAAAAASSPVPTVRLDRVSVARLDLATTLALMDDWLAPDQPPRRIATANLDFLEIAHRDDALAACLEGADLVTADGLPLVWLSRWCGAPIPERVAGSDMVPLLVASAARAGRSVYFLGGDEGVADEAIAVLRRTSPGLRVAGSGSPIVRLDDDAGCRQIAAGIASTGADLVLVALGCPKQDLFIERYLDALGCRLAVGVGGTFNFVAGRKARAPRWIQRLGLEWMHRMALEPGRLLPRYARDAVFLAGLSLRALTGRLASAPSRSITPSGSKPA